MSAVAGVEVFRRGGTEAHSVILGVPGNHLVPGRRWQRRLAMMACSFTPGVLTRYMERHPCPDLCLNGAMDEREDRRLGALRDAVAALEEAVLTVLESEPEGLGEHALLGRLREAGAPGLPPGPLGDSLVLFQSHFLLFHALYRLRDRLRGDGRADLAFGPLRIALGPYVPARPGLVDADPLRDYYLALENLLATTEADVEALLNGFWRRFEAAEGRAEALAVLGLEADADWTEVKGRYRRLAMAHHPDRGGDEERLREIHAAMATLEACY